MERKVIIATVLSVIIGFCAGYAAGTLPKAKPPGGANTVYPPLPSGSSGTVGPLDNSVPGGKQ